MTGNAAVLGVLRGGGQSAASDRSPPSPPLREAAREVGSWPTALFAAPAEVSPSPTTDDPPPHPEVAEALRELRRELSQETGHSAFVIFPNATLNALAARQPRTLAELQGVPGMGPRPIEAYGDRIVDAVLTVLDG